MVISEKYNKCLMFNVPLKQARRGVASIYARTPVRTAQMRESLFHGGINFF